MKMLILLAGLAIGATISVAWVTQPLLTRTDVVRAASQVDANQLKADVVTLTQAYPNRHHGNPEALAAASEFLAARFAVAGAKVERQSYQVNGSTYTNVIARFGPATVAAKRDAPVVVGAHYDAEEHTPGADDNASAVAGLLELARLLGERPPTIPVELVAYTLEEPPYFRTEHMGSRHHARQLVESGIVPRLVIVLEMIGYFDDAPGSQAYPLAPLNWIYPDQGNFIAVVGNLLGVAEVRGLKAAMASASPLPVWSVNAPAWIPGLDFSDHASYWREGLPAVMVTDTAFYRNHRYHEASDTPDTLDYPRMAQVVEGVLGYLRQTESEVGQ